MAHIQTCIGRALRIFGVAGEMVITMTMISTLGFFWIPKNWSIGFRDNVQS